MLDLDETIENEISRAVSFIREALDQEPSYIEMDSGEEETEPLLLDKNLDDLSFHIIKEELGSFFCLFQFIVFCHRS